MAKKLPPVHPGEILREEFLVPLQLTPYAVAAALHVPRTRIERIACKEKPVTADSMMTAAGAQSRSFFAGTPPATTACAAVAPAT